MRNLLFLAMALLILTSGCTGTDGAAPAAGSRDFYMGVVPTPKSVPATDWDGIVSAYEEAAGLGEIGMVWVVPSGIGEYDKLKQNKVIDAYRTYGLMPVVTLNFATVKEVPGEGLEYVIDAPDGVGADLSEPAFRNLWVSEARKIADEFKPEYFSLGNEVNDYFYLNPGQLDDYISLYDEAYAEIKKVSPGTKVFVVLSYTHLVDNGQWDMLKTFAGREDVIGLTTYPWKQYDDPSGMPKDYYTKIGQYTDKPIAFTEIGWVSSESEGSSEEEQAEFLGRFLELTSGLDLEMVNWLFLHEARLDGIVASVTSPATSTIALKKADGTRKTIYVPWMELKETGYGG